jgi:hypothetical protein
MPDREVRREARRRARRAFDAFAAEFTQDAVTRIECGRDLAAKDVERLAALAERLADDVTAWDRALESLDVGLDHRLSHGPTGRVLIESVFDEALTATACRVLAAAFDLAASAS